MIHHQPRVGLSAPPSRWDSKTGFVVMALLVVVTFLAVRLAGKTGLLEARLFRAPPAAPAATTAAPAPAKAEAPGFRGWDKVPDVALVLSAQMHGYLNPCGCSAPQYGGLPRRWNFMESLKARGWPVVALDLGDLLDGPGHRNPQTLLKYETAMKALKDLGYLAVGVGQYEAEMPLIETVGRFALNTQSPRLLAANLKERQNNFANAIGGWIVGSPDGKINIGVAGMIGPTVQGKIPKQNPPLDFAMSIPTLNDTLAELKKQKADLCVLLYQGTLKEAEACAAKFPQFHVILCLTEDSEPPAKPDRVGNTLIVGVGHKGRYVGVVGAYRTGKADQPFDLKYELARLEPEYEPKPGTSNPALDLLEAYTKELKDGGYLAKFTQTQHPLQVAFPKAEYVGSEACKKCHKDAYKIWAAHPHATAYQTLVNAKSPANRQFDGECVVCHTVGFTFNTGFEDAVKSKTLLNVGCENCHGPGSEHVKLGTNTPLEMLKLMNPYKCDPNANAQQQKDVLLKINVSCQKCHDIDNDVHWDFDKKWPKVVHH